MNLKTTFLINYFKAINISSISIFSLVGNFLTMMDIIK